MIFTCPPFDDIQHISFCVLNEVGPVPSEKFCFVPFKNTIFEELLFHTGFEYTADSYVNLIGLGFPIVFTLYILPPFLSLQVTKLINVPSLFHEGIASVILNFVNLLAMLSDRFIKYNLLKAVNTTLDPSGDTFESLI